MDKLLDRVLPFVPWVVVVYALTFIAGGIYALEQRVGRVRTRLPSRALLARLTGYAALGIGFLAGVSIGAHLIHPNEDYQLAALVAMSAGVGFWVSRLSAELTAAHRIRDALLALVCVFAAALTAYWIHAR